MIDESGPPSLPANGTGRRNTTLIVIGVVVLVLLCCCCGSFTLLWNYGDYLVEALSWLPRLGLG